MEDNLSYQEMSEKIHGTRQVGANVGKVQN